MKLIYILKKSLILAPFILLSACASTNANKEKVAGESGTSGDATQSSYSKPSFDAQMGSALTSPLSDLNLTRTEIPSILQQAYKEPYALPIDSSCSWLTSEIVLLDQVLGPDVDVVIKDEDGNIVGKGADELAQAAVGAMRSLTEGVIPFRSWVRKLTGAEKNAKEAAAAGIAGIVRRSYLKGIMKSKTCDVEKTPSTISQTQN